MFMNLMMICNNSYFLIIFLIIKYVFNIVCTIIPFVLMYRTAVPLFQSVVSGKEFSGDISSIFKSLISSLFIFFLPCIFSFIFVDLIGYQNGFSECFLNANLDKIQELRKEEYQKLQHEKEERKNDMNDAAAQRAEEERKKNEAIKKEREEKEKAEQEKNNSSS